MVPEGLLMARLPKSCREIPGQGWNNMLVHSGGENKTASVAALPFSLQKTASAKLGMSAQRVLDTAQSSGRKKRPHIQGTDCRYLPVEQYQEAENVLKALSSFAGLEKIAGNAHAELKSSAWNTKKSHSAPCHSAHW